MSTTENTRSSKRAPRILCALAYTFVVFEVPEKMMRGGNG
jgi:hypothetical protein